MRIAIVIGSIRDGRNGKSIGDWVAALPDGTIQEILPRRSALARRSAADRDRIQILATNIDKAIVISSLNREHDPVRLERMVRLAESSGAEPVIGLSKSDLTDEARELKERVSQAFPEVKVFVFSSRNGEGVDAVREFVDRRFRRRNALKVVAWTQRSQKQTSACNPFCRPSRPVD